MNLRLEEYRWDAENCVGCKGCVWIDHIYMPGVKYGMKCPSLARYGFDSYAAYGRGKLSLALMDGELEFTPLMLDIIYKCSLCGACDAGCKRNLDLDPLMVLETLRMRAVEKGADPLPAHKRVSDNIMESHNRYGAIHGERAAWLPKDAKVSAKPEMLYFAGCNASYRRNEIASATVGILEAAGVSFNLFPAEKCCGFPLYVNGQVTDTLKQAEGNIEALRKSGATTVVTSCAECYKAWKVDYPKMMDKRTDEMGYKVVHITEVAAQKMKEGVLKPSHQVPMRVAYHDSCNLARLSEDWVPWHGTRGRYGVTQPPKTYRRGTYGVYQPPRDILGSIPGLDFKEMIRKRENTWCCGAGGGVADAYPDFARWTARHRLEEAEDVGAEALVVSCPYCKDNFVQAGREGGSQVKVYDISQMLFEAISGKGSLE